MQIRSMLHAWETKTLPIAEAEHYEFHDKKHRNPDSKPPSFKKVVKGKIDFLGMVKGQDDKTYKKFKQQYQKLIFREKGLRKTKSYDKINIHNIPRVYTEGETDALILNTAWKKLYPELDCPFIIKDCHPTRKTDPKTTIGGTDVLKSLMKNLNDDAQFISIGVFDRDDAGLSALSEINNYVLDQDDDWKLSIPRKSGCFVLPIISGREQYAINKNLCIEFYFDDDVITRRNTNNRGLSFSLHLGKREVTYIDDPEMYKKYPELRKIKDDGGKMTFANEIVPSLNESHFEPFKIIFDKILKLIEKLESA
jgi:RNA-directed DNA polymerase